MTERKSLSGVEIKDADKGLVTAVFSTMNVRDHDGDYTREGAFTDGAKVAISAYGHKSWEGALPVGKGVIKVKGRKAVLEGQFFMNTTHGRDTFETVKQLAEDGLGEWSYGFDIDKHSYGKEGDTPVRYLDQVTVHEVSPVLLGAGINTRTLSAKGRGEDAPDGRPAAAVPAVKKAIPRHETDVVTRSWDASGMESKLPDDARPSQLRTVFAWVDPDGDPEAKSSYKFPHHHGVGGPANVRACLAGIAALNGARGGADIPDGDRKAVYGHLASHLRDADREPPELRDRSAEGSKGQTLHEELMEALAYTAGVVESASRVVALRAEKGKTLSRNNSEILGWIRDDLKRLESLISLPVVDEPTGPSEEEKASLILQSLRLMNGM